MIKRLDNKGFTLIELLAVVCIMSILLMIAVPAITKVIDRSKKDTLIGTIDAYMDSLKLDVTDGQYDFEDASTIFAVPIECIELQQSPENPYGEWLQANDDYMFWLNMILKIKDIYMDLHIMIVLVMVCIL